MSANEIRVGPGQRVLCPAPAAHRPSGQCKRHFWTVPVGLVVYVRLLALDDGSACGFRELDDICRSCRRRIRIRVAFDEREPSRLQEAG